MSLSKGRTYPNQFPSQFDGGAWQKPPVKTIYTLRIDNYAPEICELTYPMIQAYARKIGARLHTITERKFPGWPPVYEKLQIYELAQAHANDWNIYIDSDTLIHPDMIDVTEFLGKDTVCHNGKDLANVRWKYDRFFRRDHRNIGSCNWFTVASDWCIELWKPLDDLTLEEAVAQIQVTVGEAAGFEWVTEPGPAPNILKMTDQRRELVVHEPSHLIDDFTLSRNIAKYGLRFTTINEICASLGMGGSGHLFHNYTLPAAQKVEEMRKIMKAWRLG